MGLRLCLEDHLARSKSGTQVSGGSMPWTSSVISPAPVSHPTFYPFVTETLELVEEHSGDAATLDRSGE
eukprot:3943883-Prymnesium_polylepis.1